MVDVQLKRNSDDVGWEYGEMLEAKKLIKEASNHLEKNYQPIFQIMDEKMKGRLDSPLHLAAYFLNPFYFYRDSDIQNDLEINLGFIACVETFYHGDFEKQNIIVNYEINLYKRKIGSFGKDLSVRGCQRNDEKFDPGNWWATYGCHVPTLQKLATRVLALTSSSSGCERNWSSFEAIHTKKRNKLMVNRLNSLVYVQFNARLFNKHKKIKEKLVDVIIDDGNEEIVEDWIVEQHHEDQSTSVGIVPNTQYSKVRELYDDDFEFEEEDEVMVDMEF
ncbi:PREDICTED: uncharacterized protein LOC104791416 [Camelina sativa]|uniref:Uncharacterized protein LOC104791416 n=1 Tax=Camelina sativa TaxID=90675 RepID=A0ABM0ZGZ7_CAMSA|nr:PREDICTED: uncharacterized protein LOC104791416 [Camelina sativa]